MLPCLLLHNFGLEASPCNAIPEDRPSLSNTSTEVGDLPLQVRIKNDSEWKFSKSKLVHSFSGNHFSPRFMLLFIVSRKYIFRVFEVCTYPSILIHNFGLEAFPLQCDLRRQAAGLTLATRARKRELCPYTLIGTYREWLETKNFISKKFQSLSGNHFSPCFMLSCSLWAENIYFFKW